MRTDRLIAIVNYLLAHGTTSAATLAAHFEVSKRTIQRDMEAIGLAGLPVTAIPGAAGGYAIMEGYALERQILTGRDRQYLAAALQGLDTATGSKMAARAANGLRALAPEGNRHVYINLSSAREGGQVEQWIQQVEKAIEACRVLHIRYRNANREESERDIEPLALVYEWYAWYVFAYCRLRGAYRRFKLARIQACEDMGQMFDGSLHESGAMREMADAPDTRTYVDALLRCRGRIRGAVCEYINGRVVEELGNGDFLYKVHLPEGERMWFSLLLGFGGEMEVLQPPSLRERLLQCARAVEKTYQE